MFGPVGDAGSGPVPARDAAREDDRRTSGERRLPAFDSDGIARISLTRRELAVLELVARGDTNVQVAKRLTISPLTVKKHLERMYATTGSGNRAELIAFAWRRASATGNGSAARTARSGDDRLPLPLTSFIGREHEITNISALLVGSRLVTLAGPGGIGKTRLALEVARGAHSTARFVDLSALSDPQTLVQTVASTVGVGESRGPRLAALTEHLRATRFLLVLDNCEQLARACAALADQLLRSCPDLRVLATSREVLGVAGEVVWQVPPLSLPRSDGATARTVREAAARSEAVQLFIARAALRDPTFALTRENADAVAELCRRLDGIPLAIELAAARASVLSVEEIGQRLETETESLRTDGADVAPRHRTLRGVLEWSYGSLSRDEATLLQRLSVFVTGWTVAACEQVCAFDGIDAERVMGILTRLVDKSLVVADTRGPQARYRMLETVRRYALGRLSRGPTVNAVRERHASYFRALAETAEPELRGNAQRSWYERIALEHNNVRAALTWSLAHEPATALRLSGALWRFWYQNGDAPEGLLWLTRSLAAAHDAVPASRAKALNAAGNLAHAVGDRDRAELFHRECLVLRRDIGDRWGVAQSLENLGHRVLDRDGVEEARALFEEGLAIAHGLGDAYLLGILSAALGTLALATGDAAVSREHYVPALTFLRHAGDRDLVAQTLCVLADAERATGRLDRAGSLYRRALIAFRHLGDRLGVMDTVALIGALGAKRGQWAQAARLLAASAVAREASGRRFWHVRDAFIESAWHDIRAGLPQNEIAVAIDNGRSMTLERAIAHALEIAPAH